MSFEIGLIFKVFHALKSSVISSSLMIPIIDVEMMGI